MVLLTADMTHVIHCNALQVLMITLHIPSSVAKQLMRRRRTTTLVKTPAELCAEHEFNQHICIPMCLKQTGRQCSSRGAPYCLASAAASQLPVQARRLPAVRSRWVKCRSAQLSNPRTCCKAAWPSCVSMLQTQDHMQPVRWSQSSQ